jgi:hypothetical protein
MRTSAVFAAAKSVKVSSPCRASRDAIRPTFSREDARTGVRAGVRTAGQGKQGRAGQGKQHKKGDVGAQKGVEWEEKTPTRTKVAGAP